MLITPTPLLDTNIPKSKYKATPPSQFRRGYAFSDKDKRLHKWASVVEQKWRCN